MAEKISVEIGLEGGEDVRKDLEAIVSEVDGVKDAAEKLGEADATVKVKAEGADETKTAIDDVKVAAEALGQTDATVNIKVEGADEAKASLQGMNQGLEESKGLLDPISQTATIVSGSIDALGLAFTKLGARMTRSLGPLGVFARAFGPLGIAVGIAAGALVKFGNDTAGALGSLTVQAANLDLTTQQFEKLQKSFTSLGISQDAVASGAEKLKSLFGGGLMRLGDIAPPDVFEGLQQFIAQLERMPDAIARTKLAMQTLGDDLGAQVIAGLQTGTISAKNFAAALAAVTPATQEQIVQAAKYQQSINKLDAAWKQFKAEVAAPILTPFFEWIITKLPEIKAGVETTKREFAALWNIISALGMAAALVWNDPLRALNILARAVTDFSNRLDAIVWDAITSGATAAWDWVKQKVAEAKQAVLDFAAALPGVVWDAITSGATAAWDWVKQKVAEAKQAVLDFAASLPGSAWEAFKAAAVAAWDAIIAKVREYLGLAPKAGGGAPGAAGGGKFARGGLLGGRGTGTSDSNLAWVSRGEHIMPARAVQQPGVLSFLEALRRSGGDLSRVLNGMGRFALGGMVPQAISAYAAGGLAGGGNHVTIQFPGLPAIGGLRASSGVVEQLQKAAALAQVRSGGRKPSRYS